MSMPPISRREALGVAGAAALAAGTAAVRPQSAGAAPAAVFVPNVTDLVNVQQFEEQARVVLPADAYADIAGGDRGSFDRMSFRPRHNFPVLEMDLGVELLGVELFSPIIVGPVARQGRYHPEGEIATLRGAAAAFTTVVLPGDSSVSLPQLAGATGGPFWFSVYADDPDGPARARAAADVGARAIFVTARPAAGGIGVGAGAIDWARAAAIRRAVQIPAGIKGVRTAQEAERAIQDGFRAVVVSTHGVTDAEGIGAAHSVAGVAAVAAGRIPVLVDGSFRRGTDVLKALILGADVVLMARPVMWGLASFGADGVQAVLQLTQNELARSFAMLGASAPPQLQPDHLRLHRIATG